MSLTTWCDRNFHTQLTWLVDRELIKWCEAFLDEGHAAWGMPERDKGFYLSWRSLAAEEWSPCGIKDSSNKIALLPATPEDALMAHLDVMGIPEELKEDYLSFELTALCGWASFINWRAEHKGYSWQATHPIDLVQYLAVRLFYARELVNQTCLSELGVEGNLQQIVSHLSGIESDDREKRLESARLASAWRLATLAEVLGLSVSEFKAVQTEDLQKLLDWLDEFPESEHGPVWLEAYEAGYQEKLIEQLQESVKSGRASDKPEKVRPSAQAMFCIDVRSEPFRRNLESLGNYETIGFAGFFGIPMRCRAFGQHHETDQLPAIVQPKFTVHEVVREGQKEALARHKAGAGIIHTIHEMLHDMKYHVLTPYVMVESLGWLFGVQIIGRTLAPEAYRKWRAKIRKAMAPPVGTEMAADRDEKGLGLTKEEQATTIEGVLKTMGLVKNFARLVVVAGHTSTSDNNPYEAALNCGACGGNSGKPNARLLASLCNRPHVREHLRKNGIEIPEDTHFLGAVHDTTTDSLEIFDLEDLPDSHRSDLERLQKDLEDAARLTNKERCARLPGAGRNLSAEKVRAEIGRRAGDWSETRPEWGLAGNAAF
ncbi:MAG TPA: Na-translocating system protein MpsB, partial [Candidatus Melainabacteria bacterium]|nr:Na-translocating system protein MpsB [Candidatus Melainabacteria bacterium]